MKIRLKLLPLALLALGNTAYAQQPPGAGSQLNQLRTPVEQPRSSPQVLIEESTAPVDPGTQGAQVLVNELQFTGATAFNEAELLAASGFVPGTQSTLPQLQAMAARVTNFYRQRGYFVANAYLPAQDISSHVVTIAVSEGRHGEVIVRNQSRLSDDLVHQVLGDPGTGEPILIDPLESRLLRLSDIPGVNVRSTLAPGTAPGSSDLIVEIDPYRQVSGYIDADNAGNPYTGENRIGGQVNLNNLAGRGDVASLRLLTSGSGLQYGRLAYQTMLGRATVGAAYSHLDYELGKQFEALGANGTAQVTSLFGSVPLVRSRNTNIHTGLVFEHREFEDRLDAFPAANRRADADVLGLSLYGDSRDQLFGGGASRFHVTLSGGRLDIRSPGPLANDAATARTQGDYAKLWAHGSRVQYLTDTFSVSAALTAQLASKNLDPSEKFVLGGMDGVRAYAQGEGIGDEGVIASVEARLLLTPLSGHVPGQVHLLGFVDAGRITVDKDPWFAGDNQRNLSGAGVGLTWSEPGNWLVRTYYAWALGSEESISVPHESGRFWIQAVKYF